jgi:hypothetical protein
MRKMHAIIAAAITITPTTCATSNCAPATIRTATVAETAPLVPGSLPIDPPHSQPRGSAVENPVKPSIHAGKARRQARREARKTRRIERKRDGLGHRLRSQP